MNCPHCNIPLMMADRLGIEIDFCSQCRGVWLDKGELDKVIELSINPQMGGRGQQQRPIDHDRRPSGAYASQGTYASHGKGHSQQPYYNYKKKKSVIGEIFDIF